MKRDWVKGWNGGLTGPNTPSTPTVRMTCDENAHYKAMGNWKTGQPFPKSPSWSDYYIPIAVGSDTVAIAVGPDREEVATLIAKAPRMEDALRRIHAYAHPTLDRVIITMVEEALKDVA